MLDAAVVAQQPGVDIQPFGAEAHHLVLRLRLLGRLRHDPDETLWPAYRAAQAELTEGFRKAFAAALPDLPAREVRTRLHYVLGAIQQVWSHCPRPAGETPEALLASFLTFYAAGLSAPAPGGAGSDARTTASRSAGRGARVKRES